MATFDCGRQRYSTVEARLTYHIPTKFVRLPRVSLSELLRGEIGHDSVEHGKTVLGHAQAPVGIHRDRAFLVQ